MASVLSISTPTATLTFSDIDSDAAAAILHRTERRQSTTATNRRTSHPPTPGTRRFRRYLNALLSADEGDGSSSDYYSASEVERDEGEPEIWRNEWRGEFVRAGEEFFDGRVGLPRHDRTGDEEKGSRLQRRLKVIERERVQRRRERRERLERKQRQQAAADQLAASSTVTAGGVEEGGSLAMLRVHRDGVQVVEDDFVMVDGDMDRKEGSVDAEQQEEEEDELTMTSIIAGDGQWRHTSLTAACSVDILARLLTVVVCSLLPPFTPRSADSRPVAMYRQAHSASAATHGRLHVPPRTRTAPTRLQSSHTQPTHHALPASTTATVRYTLLFTSSVATARRGCIARARRLPASSVVRRAAVARDVLGGQRWWQWQCW